MATASRMFYGNYEFVPAPLITKTIENNFDAQENLIFTGVTYSLAGYLIYKPGDFGSLMDLRQEMEIALASGNQQFVVEYNDVPLMSGYPTVNSVSFEEGVWVDKIPYTIEMYEKESAGSISGIETYDESWSFTENEDLKTITVEHTVNAQGINTAGQNALENAKIYVLDQVGYDGVPSFLPAFCEGSGALVAYETYRSENANEVDGTYEITETFILSSGAYRHTVSSSFDSDEDGNITVTIDGNIEGLGRSTLKFDNAVNGWNAIKNNVLAHASGVYLRYGGLLELPSLPNTYSVAENQQLGTIDYSYGYEDDIDILPSGITEFEMSKDITEPVEVFASHTIVNKIDGPVVQDLGTSTEGTVTVAGKAVKKPDYPLADLKTYINERIEEVAPTGYGTSYRVSQKSYNIDETENIVEFSIEWTFTAPAYSSYLTYL